MSKSIDHPNPYLYAIDLRDALDTFENALVERYKADLDAHLQVWTPHGEEPSPEPRATPGPANRVAIEYNNAKEHAPAWAAEVRANVERMIPVYDTQDLNKLGSAFDDFVSAAKLLGEKTPVGVDDGIPTLVNKINGRSGHADDFTEWAGVSGETFRKNFGQSVGPTMDNQAKMAVSLVNLYDGRACIIEAVRSNTLAAFKRATDSLKETVDSGIETPVWIFVNVAIIGVGIAATGTGAVLAGAAVIGGYLDSKNPDQKAAHDIQDVVVNLMEDLGEAGIDASNTEDKWYGKVNELQKAIADTKSAELELYDFTGRDGGGSSPPAGGFDVSVEHVYKLAELCFDASEEYEQVITKAVRADGADSELRGENDVVTPGDAELKDTRHALVGFLKTTCARYYEAGCRLHDAARAYYDVDTDNEAILKALKDGPDLNGSERAGKGGPADKHVGETDRSDIEDLTDYEEPPPPPGGVYYGV